MIDVPIREFEDLVSDALDLVPDALMALVDNVAVIVEDDSPEPDVLGLYDGVPLTERIDYGGIGGDPGGFMMPDRIFIYRRPILAICETRDDVVEEVTITVVHEIAHHFGIDDDRLHELGWD